VNEIDKQEQSVAWATAK